MPGRGLLCSDLHETMRYCMRTLMRLLYRRCLVLCRVVLLCCSLGGILCLSMLLLVHNLLLQRTLRRCHRSQLAIRQSTRIRGL